MRAAAKAGTVAAALIPKPDPDARRHPIVAPSTEVDLAAAACPVEPPCQGQLLAQPDFAKRLQIEVTHDVFFVPVVTAQHRLAVGPDVQVAKG